MVYKERRELLKKLEAKRNSKIICYLTSDRKPFVASIAEDIIKVFFEHLEKIKKTKTIELFIYSRGGDVMTCYRLVNLVREYCDKFNVIIPHRAHSGATLISLGANEIYMTELGELSPIDPSTANDFNPVPQNNPNQKIPISVENVTSYISLAKEKMGLTEQDQIVNVFNRLVEKIHPLALGNVNRAHSQIRMLAKKLLDLHITGENKEHIKKTIIDNLTEKLYSHQHYISRKEAKNDIKLNIKDFKKDEQDIVLKLFNDFNSDMQLDNHFEPLIKLSKQDVQEVNEPSNLAFIEDINFSDFCAVEYKFKKVITNPNIPDAFQSITIPIKTEIWKRQ